MKLSLEHTAIDIEGNEADNPDPSPPPDGGFGWVVVGACSAINCFTWGVTAVIKALILRVLGNS